MTQEEASEGCEKEGIENQPRQNKMYPRNREQTTQTRELITNRKMNLLVRKMGRCDVKHIQKQ